MPFEGDRHSAEDSQEKNSSPLSSPPSPPSSDPSSVGSEQPADDFEQEKKRLLKEIERIASWTNIQAENGLFGQQHREMIETTATIYENIQQNLYMARISLHAGDLAASDRYLSQALKAYDKALYAPSRLWRFLNIYAGCIWLYFVGILGSLAILSLASGPNLPQDIVIFGVIWGCIGSIAHASFYLSNQVRDRTYRRAYDLYFFIYPLYGGLIGILAYSIVYTIISNLIISGSNLISTYGYAFALLISLMTFFVSPDRMIKLIRDGYGKFQLREYRKEISLPTKTITVAAGIERQTVPEVMSTEDTRKVEDAFERILKEGFNTKVLKNSQKIRKFVDWSKREVKEDPDWFLSRITNKFIDELLTGVRPYYASIFLKEINTYIQKILEDHGYDKNEYNTYKIVGLEFDLNPVEFYVELAKLGETETESNSATARLTFKIDTQLKIEGLIARISPAGTKINIESLTANLKLSLSRISISKLSIIYLYKEPQLELVLGKQEFKVNNLFTFESYRNVHFWLMKNGKDHKATEPLIIGHEYALMIRISNNSSDTKDHMMVISTYSEGFKFKEMTKELLLAGYQDSETSFKIIPQSLGVQTLEVFFYHKHNLLQRLSITLEVIQPTPEFKLPPNPIIIKFKEEEKYLPAHVITSTDVGLGSIAELEASTEHNRS